MPEMPRMPRMPRNLAHVQDYACKPPYIFPDKRYQIFSPSSSSCLIATLHNVVYFRALLPALRLTRPFLPPSKPSALDRRGPPSRLVLQPSECRRAGRHSHARSAVGRMGDRRGGAGPLARSRLRVPGRLPDALWICQAAG